MKQMKRLFSVLLATALTAQMGMVAGFGADCGTNNDHGKNGYVKVACGETTTHWLGGGTTLTGGGGTNYFYVTGGETVQCGTGENIIVAQKMPTTQVTINDFTFGQDKLYICGADSLTPDPDTDAYLLMNDGDCIVEIGVGGSSPIPTNNIAEDLPVDSSLSFAPSGSLPINLNQSGTISTSLNKQGQGKLTYSWEKSADSGANWTPIPGEENASYTVPSEDTTAPTVGLQYRCTVMDEIGQTDSVITTVNVVGCTVTASFNSGYSIPNQNISNTGNKQVSLPNVNAIVNIGNEPCTMNHTGHGYSVVWATTQTGVTISGDTMTLTATTATAENFSVGDNAVTLTATLKKEGQDVAAPPTTQDYTFTVTREAAPVAPTCNAHATLGAITVDNGGKTITGENRDVSFTVAMNVAGGTSPCQVHSTDANHGYTVEWELIPAVEGVTLVENGNSGTLKIEKEKLPIPTQTTASLTAKLMRDGQPTGPSATTSVSFQQIACQAKPVGITLTTPARTTPEVVVDHSNAAATVFNPFTAAVTGWTGECSEHTTSGDHNKSISWSLASAPQGVTINSATGDLTVDGTKLTQEKTTVRVMATVTANGESKTGAADVTLSTTILECGKNVKEVKINGKNELSFTTTGTVTEDYTAEITVDGQCTLESDPSHVHASATWSIIKMEIPSGTNVQGVTIGPVDSKTGRLTIPGGNLPVGQPVKVTLQATAVGKDSQAKTATYEVTITRTAPPPPPSSDNTESVEETNRREWESFEDKIDDARRGSTLRMSLNGNTDCPFYIFDAIRGRDLTLELKVDNNYTWTVNGKSLKKLPSNLIYLSLDVEKYRNSKMISLCRGNDVKAFQLGHEGSFYGDMKLTMDVGAGNAKKTMFLYSYDEDKEKLTYCTSAIADSRGDATFTFTRSLGAYVVTSKALYGENPVSSGGGVVGSGSRPSTVYPPVASSTPRPSTPRPSTSVPPPPSSSSASSSSESSSSSSESSSSESIPAPPPSSLEPAEPADTSTQPEEKQGIPFLVPALILAIAGVITATVLVVRSGKGKEIDFDD